MPYVKDARRKRRCITRFLLPHLVPLAFIAWAPVRVLLEQIEALPFPAALAWASPLVGAVLLYVAFLVFRRESGQ